MWYKLIVSFLYSVWFTVFGVKLLYLVRSIGPTNHTSPTTLTIWPLNLVDTNYTVNEITYFIYNKFLFTRYIRLSTFEILSKFFFTISTFCNIVFTSYGNDQVIIWLVSVPLLTSPTSTQFSLRGFSLRFSSLLSFPCLIGS